MMELTDRITEKYHESRERDEQPEVLKIEFRQWCKVRVETDQMTWNVQVDGRWGKPTFMGMVVEEVDDGTLGDLGFLIVTDRIQ